LLLALAAALLAATAATAQDDGARVYLPTPVGAQALTGFAVFKRGDEEPEPGSYLPGTKIDTDLAVLRYVRTFSLAGRPFSPFLILPTGRVSTRTGEGETVTSSGFGDLQLGATFSLVGMPALAPEAFATYRPGFGLGLFAKVYFPTGAYSRTQALNLGANRYAFQVGLPTSFALGASYRDPALTTFDVLPTLTFYQANTDPFGAHRSAKAALFSVESHLTRNLSPTVWISGDLLYRQGGETTTDGVADDNATRGLSGGGSVAFVLSPQATLVLTGETVITRSDGGPDGWFFRAALVLPF
jgi:hypothetical protein